MLLRYRSSKPFAMIKKFSYRIRIICDTDRTENIGFKRKYLDKSQNTENNKKKPKIIIALIIFIFSSGTLNCIS